MTGSVVYFIENAAAGTVKIGTTRKIAGRLAQLRSASSDPLNLLGAIAGGDEIEASVHARFANHRVRGEWFTLNEQLRLEIGALIAERGAAEHGASVANDDPFSQQARKWAVLLLDEAGGRSAFGDAAQAAGVTPGLIYNLYRKRIAAVTARDYEALRLAALCAYESRLRRINHDLDCAAALIAGCSADDETKTKLRTAKDRAEAMYRSLTGERAR